MGTQARLEVNGYKLERVWEPAPSWGSSVGMVAALMMCLALSSTSTLADQVPDLRRMGHSYGSVLCGAVPVPASSPSRHLAKGDSL